MEEPDMYVLSRGDETDWIAEDFSDVTRIGRSEKWAEAIDNMCRCTEN